MKDSYRLNPLSIFFKISSGLRLEGGGSRPVLGFFWGKTFVLGCRGDEIDGLIGNNSCI